MGTVKDDGLPSDTLTTTWEQVSGPENGEAKFVDATAANTTVTFNREGDYVLKLTAFDGEKTGFKEVTVHGIPSDGTVNVASQSTASASFTNPYQAKDNAKKVIDGQVLYTNTPNETWNNWGDNTGTEPWLQLAWDGTVPLKKAKLFFWTDGGGVPMVKSWKLQYADENGDWQDVKLAAGQSYTTMQGEGNEVRFAETVETNKLRVLFPKGAIVGATEFEAYALDPVSVDGVNRMVQTGSKAADVNLPKTVSASYTDGSRRDLSVAWDAITDDQLASDSEFAVSGTVIGALAGTKATIGRSNRRCTRIPSRWLCRLWFRCDSPTACLTIARLCGMRQVLPASSWTPSAIMRCPARLRVQARRPRLQCMWSPIRMVVPILILSRRRIPSRSPILR